MLKTSSNNIKIHFPKKERFQFFSETKFLQEEVKQYFKYGIQCNEGDTVFDIGANIGLFSIYVHQICNHNVNIYSFEPIPSIFESLSRNISQLKTEKIKIFPFGLSNSNRVADFAYHPNAPALSSTYPVDSHEFRIAIRNNVIENLKYAPRHIQRLLSLVPKRLHPFFIDRDLNQIFQFEMVRCQLKKLSDVIRDHSIQKINLLKIDVERSELDVLLGIDSEDWPKIEQIVIEVHDVCNQLETIKTLLEKKGFEKIFVQQDPFLKAIESFTIYALRFTP